ncbi:hypothetical protein GCM10027570_40710 [Streptomonospora sediminis]
MAIHVHRPGADPAAAAPGEGAGIGGSAPAEPEEGSARAVGRALLRWVRLPADTAVEAVWAGLGLALLAAAGLGAVAAAVLPPARRPVGALVRACAWRLALCRGRLPFAPGRRPAPRVPGRPGSGRVLGYLAARLLPAALGALALALLAIGVVLASIALRSAATGNMGPAEFLMQVVIGVALLMLDLQAMASALALERHLARALLAPSARERLEQRVSELTESRAGIIAAVDAERQRIERDLHDGLQQRLVALGMLLGRARRSGGTDTAKVAELLGQAHESTQRAVAELREVAWRVYPSALDHAGLEKALTLVAQRSGLPVRLTCTLPERLGHQVEVALYFVACEAITNAAKHSGADCVTVEITRHGGQVVMRARDDGAGGADPAGTGLSGLARRVAALDGRFRLDSPPGGPTALIVELPCE